ncbi:MAG: long-chain fatty acid--CoA ligase [Kineosporiaceae bacterium]
MTARVLHPEELLRMPFDADELNRRTWSVDWQAVSSDDLDRLARRHLPPFVDVATSGSTGGPQVWRLTRDQVLAEARVLADLFAARRPVGVVSFAPPRHRYGLIASVMLPAVLRASVTVVPTAGMAPLPQPAPGEAWLVAAIPWSFTLLARRPEWLAGIDRLTILHSSARLPESAADLRAALGGNPPRIVELLGSTEAGPVATRDYPSPDGLWDPLPGVELVGDARQGVETRLELRSPLLAQRPGSPPEATSRSGDLVRREGSRRFRLTGRHHRLVKINGRRYDLDQLENRLRARLPGRDLACVPVTDPVAGEHFDVLVTSSAAAGDDAGESLRTAVAEVGVAPRRLRLVPLIARSGTGKVLAAQPRVHEEG